jgi:tripartite-type tricarboxylate transporter receptor subunit TctC
LNYGSAGAGGVNHLVLEMLKSRTGTFITHIPYRGVAPATMDMIAGQVHLVTGTIPALLPFIRDGRVKALAVTSARRAPQIPEVPTIDEAGVAGYDAAVWFGLFAPRGTPPAVLVRLHDEIVAVIRQPEVESGYLASGNLAITSRPAEFGAFIREEIAKWGRVVREAKIQGE